VFELNLTPDSIRFVQIQIREVQVVTVVKLKGLEEKYDFGGQLTVTGCQYLVHQIEQRSMGKGREREGLVEAKMWLDKAQRNKNGMDIEK